MIEHARYGSKYTLFRVDAQGPDQILHPVTGSVVGHKKPLVAEFGEPPEEFVPRDATGEPLHRDENGEAYVALNLQGNFKGKYWDSETAQAHNGWSDAETEAVIAQVEYFCRTQPDIVWKLEEVRVPVPWPTYEDMHHKKIPGFAIDAGRASEALAYERQRDNPRPEIISILEDHLAQVQREQEAESALTAV